MTRTENDMPMETSKDIAINMDTFFCFRQAFLLALRFLVTDKGVYNIALLPLPLHFQFLSVNIYSITSKPVFVNELKFTAEILTTASNSCKLITLIVRLITRNMYDIVFWVVFGVVAGFIATRIRHDPEQSNIVFNIIIGIVGSLLGGFIAGLLGLPPVSGFNVYSFIVAILGAIGLLTLYRSFH